MVKTIEGLLEVKEYSSYW